MNKWFVIHDLLSYNQHKDLIGSAVKSPGVLQPKGSNFSNIKKGDLVVYYASKDYVIVGIFQVISDLEYLPNDHFWQEIMVYRIKPIEMPKEGYYLAFKQLLKDPKVKFDLFPDKSLWGTYLQGKTCISLTERDFSLIKYAITNQNYLSSVENFKTGVARWQTKQSDNQPVSSKNSYAIRHQEVIENFERLNEQKQTRMGIATEMTEWERLKEKIVDLQSVIAPFKVEFLDRDSFKRFCDNLNSNLMNLKEICITGYFSETIRAEIESFAQNNYYHVRLISPDFPIGTPRDKKNLEALRKLSKAGVEVKFNNRIHARLLVAHTHIKGLLILGSFDFNTECIGKERYDAGIKTSHPDLIQSAVNFFEQVWTDSETQTLERFLRDKKVINS